jgi:hypothetical protein
MVAKGKEKAGLKPPSAVITRAASRESTIADTTPAPTQRMEETEEPSDEDEVNAAQLQALRKRVKEKEEYHRLLRRIEELEREESVLAPQTPRRQNGGITLPTGRGPRFEKHTLEYRGKNLQELRQWIRALEDDHKNFPDTFVDDQKRIFYASKAIKHGTLAYKHWVAKREQIDSLDEISWDDFLEVLYDALGSKEARRAQAYYDHQEAKWDPRKQSIVDFHRKLKSYEETFVNPVDDHYLYYQLWRQIPDEYRDKLIGTNKPKTRDDIVKAIEELEIDRKRDRSKSDADKQSESKRPKRDHKTHSSKSRSEQGHSTSSDNPKAVSKEDSKPQKDSRDTSKVICYRCMKPGHKKEDCRTKKPNQNEGATQGNSNRIAAAATPSSGKDQASPTTSQSQRRQEDQ